MTGNKFKNIAGAATTPIKSGRGSLFGITVNKAVASGVITVYDSLTATGNKIATITNPGTLTQNQFDLEYHNIEFAVGLTIVTSAADDITVVYN